MGAVPDERVQGWVVAGRRTLDRRGDRGASAVEFALVMIPLLTLVFGVISYGYMLSFRQALSQGAAEAARAAATAYGPLDADQRRARAVAAINDAVASYGITCSADGTFRRGGEEAGTCAVSAPEDCVDTGPAQPSGGTGGPVEQCIEVALSYTYRDDSLLPDVGFKYVMPAVLEYTTRARVS